VRDADGFMSSAYVVSETPVGGSGRSAEVYKLNKMDDSTPPSGTPVLNFCFYDLLFWYSVYPFRSFI